MNRSSSSLTVGARFANLYRPLARNLILIVLGTAAAAVLAMVYFDERLVERLSSQLIASNNARLEERVEGIFDDAEDRLAIALRQVRGLDIDEPEDREILRAELGAYLQELERLDSINLADGEGREFALLDQGEDLLVRHIAASEPDIARWQRWRGGELQEEWTRQSAGSPLERPWYRGAVAQGEGRVFWSEPYSFLTTREAGISVSSSIAREGGESAYVLALNVTLAEISTFTITHQPSENGLAVVFGPQGRTIGLPADPRFQDAADFRSAVLTPVPELGIPVLTRAVATWEEAGRPDGVAALRGAEGGRWWYGFSGLELEGNALWLAMLIPERDFVGSIARQRNLALGGVLAAGLAAAALTLLLSLRRIRQQMRSAIDRIEERLGQYRLRQKIGQGGNGTVYLADHALLRRPTAVKLMNEAFARSEEARRRFEHEVQITSSLSHPNTIAIYDYGHTPDGTLYYAMELLNGHTLEQVVRASGPMPPARVIHVMVQMAGSLAEAHGRQLIHRDIKPSNAILCERGGLLDVVKVLDFGLVKEVAPADGNLTQENMLVGTPLYMAPEVIREPGRVSPASDLYALGAVAYFLLTGQTVFEGASPVEICARHLHDDPLPPSRRAGLAVPEDLEAVVMQCLAKDPEARPESAAALGDALRACADAGGWTQRDAAGWWAAHSGELGGAAGAGAEPTPLSDTELLVDLDERILTSRGSEAGG